MSRRLTRDAVLETVHDALVAEYGSSGQWPTARAIVRALEDEGVHHDGWTTETEGGAAS